MIDLVRISVKAGAGGSGCISFRREKFVAKGGPDGGDGGNGGNVFIVGDPSLNTLLHLRYHSTWIGKRGAHGGGRKMTGANGGDVSILVPVGTVVWKLEHGGEKELLVDVGSTSPVLVARGGSGGVGNKKLVSSTNQEPVLAEKGEKGESLNLLLELKLLADVGVVGKPNAGKSTLLSTCSHARPKIAEYPFTTTDPVLGVVSVKDNSFVMMEVPGLIEGAHTGAGLGHEFLRHAERARVLIHILDGSGDDPVADWKSTNHELTSYDDSLGRKPQVLAVNKLDMPEVRDTVPAIEAELGALGIPVFFISAATGEGVDGLLARTLEELSKIPNEEKEEQDAIVRRPAAAQKTRSRDESYRLTVQGGRFIVEAPRLERLVEMADMRDTRAMIQIWRELKILGAARELEDMGIQMGDTVRIGKVDLEWY